MEKKLDIFILAYKDFDCIVKHPCYKIVDGGECSKEYSLPIYHDNIGDNITELNGFWLRNLRYIQYY